MKILKIRDVVEKTSLSQATIWRYEREKKFPQRKSLGTNRVGWIESEINEWIQSRFTPKENYLNEYKRGRRKK